MSRWVTRRAGRDLLKTGVSSAKVIGTLYTIFCDSGANDNDIGCIDKKIESFAPHDYHDYHDYHYFYKRSEEGIYNHASESNVGKDAEN